MQFINHCRKKKLNMTVVKNEDLDITCMIGHQITKINNI